MCLTSTRAGSQQHAEQQAAGCSYYKLCQIHKLRNTRHKMKIKLHRAPDLQMFHKVNDVSVFSFTFTGGFLNEFLYFPLKLGDDDDDLCCIRSL